MLRPADGKIGGKYHRRSSRKACSRAEKEGTERGSERGKCAAPDVGGTLYRVDRNPYRPPFATEIPPTRRCPDRRFQLSTHRLLHRKPARYPRLLQSTWLVGRKLLVILLSFRFLKIQSGRSIEGVSISTRLPQKTTSCRSMVEHWTAVTCIN